MISKNKPVKLNGKKVFPVWSGSRLSKLYDRFHDSHPVGEVWETSIEDGYEATVLHSDGEITFTEYLNELGAPNPPLIKLLDSATPLSIQVHPDEDSARKFCGVSKNEMWYILSAEADSSILYGIKSCVENGAIDTAIDDGSIDKIMNRVQVKAGDVYMLPSGMLHSLGGGITVLEVQNKAGTTYRVKDICSNRDVHKVQAKGSYKNYSKADAEAFLVDSTIDDHLPIPGKIIARNKDFSVTIYKTEENSSIVHTQIAGVYMFCENGSGEVDGVSFATGESLYLPSPEEIRLAKNSSLIFVI